MANIFGKYLLVLFVVIAQIGTCKALFFHAKYSDKRCFTQEIPENTMVTGKYKVELESWNSTFGNYSLHPQELQKTSESLFGLIVEVKDAAASVVMSKMFGLEGKFTFTSHDSGVHLICLSPNGTSSNSLESLRIHFDVNIGGHAVDYEVVQRLEKLTKIQLRLRKLLDHTDQIRKEQHYQRVREMHFRKLSESIESKILRFSILQWVILVSVGFIQVFHLKEFFTQKKLV